MISETLAAPLERASRLFRNRPAVVDGDVRWTYADLDARVAAFDCALDDLGLRRGDVVAVLAANSAAHLVAWLAIPRSGRVLNDLNVRLSTGELEFILRDSSAKALLVDADFADVGAALRDACPAIEHLIVDDERDLPARAVRFADVVAGSGVAPRSVDPETLAGIFYTGGTTGDPKGVMLSHRNLVANAKHVLIALGYGSRDVYLHAAPMFHLADGGSTYALTWVGGCHAIVPSFAPSTWLRAVEEHRVTLALLVPTMLNMLVNAPELGDHDLSSLESVLYGASPIALRPLLDATAALGCDFCQGFGMTEAAPLVSLLGHEDHRLGARGDEPHLGRLRSAGQPVVGVEVQVRDVTTTTEVPLGEPGEIWVRGPNVMMGYLNRPEETDAVLTEDGWYRSGDVGRQDEDGYLFIVDRLKDMIITGGENVYSSEVENALHSHPAVLECAVFGVPNERWGEQVHAAVVLREDAHVTAEDLVGHCQALIAAYKVPRSFDFHDSLPKSGAGKILKRELREPHWKGRDVGVN
jgi:long-chain acyl-CoA synthetase